LNNLFVLYLRKIKPKGVDRKIRVGAVSYLNTKPLVYGFEKGMMKDDIELEFEYPALVAHKLLNNEIDLGLVPIAVLENMDEYHIIGAHGIGCKGKVASVCLFSKVPIQQIDKVFLDYQSRTSVRLVQILMKHYWKITPTIVQGEPGFEELIENNSAGVIIGDRALNIQNDFPFIYDLGEAWFEFTGLPFLFAAWISNIPLPETFIRKFEAANQFGIDHLEKVITENPFPPYNLQYYYQENILFELTQDLRDGMDLFLSYVREMKL
jgi:chorismate dehydratase